MNELEVRELGIAFDGRWVLREVDLKLAPGTFLAVTGPSGAGKSALLWTMAGALPPAEGAVHLGGVAVTDRVEATDAGVALIPQGNGLVMTLTALENAMLPLLGRGTDHGAARQAARGALETLGLADHVNHLVEELSGGQQQRVAIARALAGEPTVIIADEPTSDLDSVNRGRVLELLAAEAVRGAIVVMSTNDPEAVAVADREFALA